MATLTEDTIERGRRVVARPNFIVLDNGPNSVPQGQRMAAVPGTGRTGYKPNFTIPGARPTATPGPISGLANPNIGADGLSKDGRAFQQSRVQTPQAPQTAMPGTPSTAGTPPQGRAYKLGSAAGRLKIGPLAAAGGVISNFNDYKINEPEVDSSAMGTIQALASGDFSGAGRSLSKGALEAAMDLGSFGATTADVFLPGQPASEAYRGLLQRTFGNQLVDNTNPAAQPVQVAQPGALPGAAQAGPISTLAQPVPAAQPAVQPVVAPQQAVVTPNPVRTLRGPDGKMTFTNGVTGPGGRLVFPEFTGDASKRYVGSGSDGGSGSGFDYAARDAANVGQGSRGGIFAMMDQLIQRQAAAAGKVAQRRAANTDRKLDNADQRLGLDVRNSTVDAQQKQGVISLNTQMASARERLLGATTEAEKAAAIDELRALQGKYEKEAADMFTPTMIPGAMDANGGRDPGILAVVDRRTGKVTYSAAPVVAPPPPKVGMVQDGYRFKGGDPKVGKNWEKV